MTREEMLACLNDRPCDVCKFHTENGCKRWKCVFEEELKEDFDGMTNGEVIQAIFNVMVLTVKDGKVWVEKIYFPFDEIWWNAPYKTESEDK